MHYRFISLRKCRHWSVLLCLLLIAGCAATARFDRHVYIETVSAKVDALNVMDAAVDDYAAHRQELRQVLVAMDKVYEYERNRQHNDITIRLWDKLRDSSGHLFGGFVKRWKKEGKLRPVFILESKKEVAEAFDVIAQLESRKIKPKQVKE